MNWDWRRAHYILWPFTAIPKEPSILGLLLSLLLSVQTFGQSGDKKINEEIKKIPLLPVKDVKSKQFPAKVDEVINGYMKRTTTSTKGTEARTFEDLVAFQPNAGKLWPGALIKGRSINNGLLDLISPESGKGTITVEDITLLPVGNNKPKSTTVTLPELRNGTVKDAITSVITQKMGATPARILYRSHEMDTLESSMLQVGASASWMGGDLKAAFNKRSSESRRVFLARFVQSYYTVSLEQPLTPSMAFSKKTKWKHIKDQMGINNPPMYVSSVTYGRQLLLLVESTSSSELVGATLDATFSGAGWKAGVNLSAEQQKTINESSMMAFIVGGAAQDGIGVIAKMDKEGLYKFLKDGANFNPATSPGLPITYRLSYLADNSIARLSYAEDYESVRYSERPLRIESMKVHYWTEGDDKDGPESVATFVCNGDCDSGGAMVGASSYVGGGGEWDDQTDNGEHNVKVSGPVSVNDCSKLRIKIDKTPDNGNKGSGWNFSFSLDGILEDGKRIPIRPRQGGDRLGDDQPRSKSFSATCPF